MGTHQPPSYFRLATELPRSGMETLRALAQLKTLTTSAPRGDGRPVLTIPGYGGGDNSMLILRHLLGQIGYETHKLDLGINVETAQERIRRVEDAVAFRERMVAQVSQRVREIAQARGQRVTLVGWSLGGLYAYDIARAHAGLVQHVITLGAPYGDPRGTSTFNLLRWINRSTVPIEEQDFNLWLDKRTLPEQHGVPIDVVFSQQDGIVSPDIARLDDHPLVSHHEINSSHVGFTVNPEALQTVATLLAKRNSGYRNDG